MFILNIYSLSMVSFMPQLLSTTIILCSMDTPMEDLGAATFL